MSSLQQPGRRSRNLGPDGQLTNRLRSCGTLLNCFCAAAPACVLLAPHDISPPLDEQLVLELKGRIAVGEAVDILPGGGRSGLSFPLDENLTDATG